MDLAYEEISQELETQTVNHRKTVLSLHRRIQTSQSRLHEEDGSKSLEN